MAGVKELYQELLNKREEQQESHRLPVSAVSVCDPANKSAALLLQSQRLHEGMRTRRHQSQTYSRQPEVLVEIVSFFEFRLLSYWLKMMNKH